MGAWAWLVPGASSSLPKKLPGLPPPPAPVGQKRITSLCSAPALEKQFLLSGGRTI